MMLREEFEKQYCKNSDMAIEEYRENFVTLPCKCGEEGCNGWACVCNSPLNIKTHKRLYGV